jgi:hypothetical protein
MQAGYGVRNEVQRCPRMGQELGIGLNVNDAFGFADANLHAISLSATESATAPTS